MKRKEFQELATLRLREAELLLKARCWEGAYYLAGYAAESALKACIAKLTERHEFPDRKRADQSYTHNLAQLLKVAGLEDVLRDAVKGQPKLDANWLIVARWSEQSRYEKRSPRESQTLLNALKDRDGGVLRWLRQHW